MKMSIRENQSNQLQNGVKKTQYYVDGQTAKISPLSSKCVGKYEFLSG